MAEAHSNAVIRNPQKLRWMDVTLPDPAANLRLDEELLAAGEGVFRVWEASADCVVLGQSGRPEREAKLDVCAADGVPVLRRCSGGGSVVLGPGCLNYAIVLSYEWNPKWHDVRHSIRWVMDLTRAALAVPDLQFDGQSDLTIDGKKVSGNAQRRARSAFLHHGTLLYDFDPLRAERFLRLPARQPAYRAGRGHAEFLANLPLTAPELKRRLAAAWC